MSAVPELNANAARERQAPQPEENEEPAGPTPVRTAFLVFVTHEGETVMNADINVPIVPERPPSRDEVKGACQNVKDFMVGQETTVATVQNVIGNLQAAAQAQMQQQQIASDPRVQEALASQRKG